jgi:vacuolar-type H+-ATPase subunit I/STV1
MAAKGEPETIVQGELETSNQLINDLKEQVVQLIADNDNLDKRLESLADTQADDLKTVPHQAYKTVDRVMYAMAQLTKVDNSKPYSQNNPSLNASITTLL